MLIALALAIAAHLLLSRTVFGRHVYAIGNNSEGGGDLRRAGAPHDHRSSSPSPASAPAVAAILYSARLEGGRPTIGGGSALLDIIGATVIGGTSLAGGKGKITWTFVGVLFFVLLSNTLNYMRLSAFHIDVVKGAIILAAALLDVLRTRLVAGGAADERRRSWRSSGIGKSFFGVRCLAGRDAAARARPRARPRRAERRRQVDADEHHRRRRAARRRDDAARRRALRAGRRRARPSGSGIAFIHQELNLFTNLTIAENIFIGRLSARPRRADRPRGARASGPRRCCATVDLDLPPDTPVERLSPGERQLVEVAKALQLDARIIIFDEPTTSLTPRETDAAVRADRPAAAPPARRSSTSRTSSPTCAALADDIAVLRDGRLVGDRPEGRVPRRPHDQPDARPRHRPALSAAHAAPARDEVLLEARGLSLRGIVKDIDLQRCARARSSASSA